MGTTLLIFSGFLLGCCVEKWATVQKNRKSRADLWAQACKEGRAKYHNGVPIIIPREPKYASPPKIL